MTREMYHTPQCRLLHWSYAGMLLSQVNCNLPPALLAEWLESFTCHCSNMVVERTPKKSQHTVNSGEENSPTASAGFEIATFCSQVQCFSKRAIQALCSINLLQHNLWQNKTNVYMSHTRTCWNRQPFDYQICKPFFFLSNGHKHIYIYIYIYIYA